jgi:hypothetical protein
MRYILIIILINACSSYTLTTEEKIQLRWMILENAVNEKWNSQRIIQKLGQPKEVRLDGDEESWYYESSENAYQEWSVGLKDQTVTRILYIPTGVMDQAFTLDKALERWKKRKCEKMKSKMYMRGHTAIQDHYYLCGNAKININRYNEVSSILIE